MPPASGAPAGRSCLIVRFANGGGLVAGNSVIRFSVVSAVIKLAAGITGMVALSDVSQAYQDHANQAYNNAAIAAQHALVDGRANVSGYLDDSGNAVTDPVGPTGTVAAVPASDASTAVAADQAMISVLLDLGDQNQETVKWVLGGAAALGLLTLGGVYVDVERIARELQDDRKRTAT
jgi:hypothetical protein